MGNPEAPVRCAIEDATVLLTVPTRTEGELFSQLKAYQAQSLNIEPVGLG
jgi:hypothetical protein